jgi:FkbM family methyltransferase
MQDLRRFLEKVFGYGKGILSSFTQLKPNALLKAIANSNDVIKQVELYDFSIVLNINDKFIGRPILLKSSYEENVTRVLLQHLKPDIHFLDIGANIGFFSLLVASQCPESTVISFEPDATNFKLLQMSRIYNRFEARIRAYPLAVSDRNETILLAGVGDQDNSGAKITSNDRDMLEQFTQSSGSNFQTIQAVQLDAFLTDARIDLVKLDIEGHEPFAIQGMLHLLKQNQPVILVEFSPISLTHIGKTSPADFLQTFIDLGYHLTIIPPSGELVPCEQNATAVLQYFQNQATNHLDLLLEIPGG